MIIWSDPAVQSAVIQSAGTVTAAIIAAVIAAFVGRQFSDRKRLQEKLLLAQGDIAFLLAVEDEHCNLHKQNVKESNKRRMRRAAFEKGLVWSGKFTPGRIRVDAVTAGK